MLDKRFPPFGTVSHGTLRDEDLLDAFADELELACSNYGADRSQYAELIHEARRVDPDTEEASETIMELMDALNEFAAPYSYFGAHEGDGSDFGFWPDIQQIEDWVRDGEITKVDDLSEANEPGEYIHVNDHGNMTFGYVDQSGDFHEIWSIV